MRNRRFFSELKTERSGLPLGSRLVGLLKWLWGIGWLLALVALPAWAMEKSVYKVGHKVEYRDIYLTENRVCKACRLEWVDSAKDQTQDQVKVRLVNRAGEASIVPARQVLGIDRHPIVRKAMLHALRGVGLPGEVLVPSAFDDGNDFVCKYCSTFNR